MALPAVWGKERFGAALGYTDSIEVTTGSRVGGAQWAHHASGSPLRYDSLSCTSENAYKLGLALGAGDVGAGKQPGRRVRRGDLDQRYGCEQEYRRLSYGHSLHTGRRVRPRLERYCDAYVGASASTSYGGQGTWRSPELRVVFQDRGCIVTSRVVQ